MKRTILAAFLVLTLLVLLATPLAAWASSASPVPDAAAATGGGFSTATWAILAIVAISVVAIIVWLVKRPKHTEVD